MSCLKTNNANRETCVVCGGVPAVLHRTGTLFRRESRCATCCPVHCASVPRQAVNAQQPVRADAVQFGPARDARGRTIDPWYRDTRREDAANREHWIPKRSNWFKR